MTKAVDCFICDRKIKTKIWTRCQFVLTPRNWDFIGIIVQSLSSTKSFQNRQIIEFSKHKSARVIFRISSHKIEEKRKEFLWSVKIPESRPLKPAYLRLSDLQNAVVSFHWLNGKLIVPDRNPNKKPSDEKAIGKGILATNQQYFCLHVKSKFLKKFPSLATRDFVAKMNFVPR